MIQEIDITFQEMRNVLKKDKNWKVSQSGQEYLFTFHCAKFPIEIKVFSGIDTKTDHSRLKEGKAIRLCAIAENGTKVNGKMNYTGLVSTKYNTVPRNTQWKFLLTQKVYKVLDLAKKQYKQQFEWDM